MCYEEEFKAMAVRSQNTETPGSGENRVKQAKGKIMENTETVGLERSHQCANP